VAGFAQALGNAGHKEPTRLGLGLPAESRILNLGLQSPIPHVIRIDPDAEKICGEESEFRRSHSDDTNDDAVRSGNDPALPQLFPDEHRRKDGQKAR